MARLRRDAAPRRTPSPRCRRARLPRSPSTPGSQCRARTDNPRFILKRCTGRNLIFSETRNKPLLDQAAVRPSRPRSPPSGPAWRPRTDAGRKASLRKELMQTLAFKHLMVGGTGAAGGPARCDRRHQHVRSRRRHLGHGLGHHRLPREGARRRLRRREGEGAADLDKHYVQKLLYLAGFLYDRGTYYVADPDEKTVRVHHGVGHQRGRLSRRMPTGRRTTPRCG